MRENGQHGDGKQYWWDGLKQEIINMSIYGTTL